MNKPKITSSSVKIKAALLFDREGFAHSAMLSNNPLWSAGQRSWRNAVKITRDKKTKKRFLSYSPITLSISPNVILSLAEQVKEHKRKLESRRNNSNRSLSILDL